ncbi:MAG TPA: hypothetical protein VJT75_07675, partial [Thermoleophilaceae bacterium]|nr:hypothetical protein [Thermoleophilaceae bacterium]
MTLRIPQLRNLAALVAAFAVAALALTLLNRAPDAPDAPASTDLAQATAARSTDAQVATLQRELG